MADKNKKESVLEWALLFFLMVLIIVSLIWLFGSHKVVFGTTKLLYYAAVPYRWIGEDKTWEELTNTARVFYFKPNAVTFLDYIAFVNITLRPLMVGVCLVFACMVIFLMRRPGIAALKSKIGPDALLKIISNRFTGVLPVLKIRKDIVTNANPRWARQLSPEDYLKSLTLPGSNAKVLVVPPNRRLEEATFSNEDLRTALIGIDPKRYYKANGRNYMISSTLGRQVVNLLLDSQDNEKICFPERFSSEGKVIYALFCAYAFGGKEGKKDFEHYADALNRSAFGDPNGMAKLSLAQPLFDKHKNNPIAKKIFVIHNWENTYLVELMRQAKRQGKTGHWMVMWLLPTNRVLYMSLQNFGMKTPHAENASTFNQYLYERACLRLGRLPISKTQFENGASQMTPHVFVEGAIEGLALEWTRWVEGTEDSEDVWKSKDLWKGTRPAIAREFMTEFAMMQAKATEMSAIPSGGESEFDKSQSAARAEIAKKAQQDLNDELSFLNTK